MAISLLSKLQSPNVRTLLLVLLFFAWQGNAYGQVRNSDFELYNTWNGLPHEHITCLEQDLKGFIWVGTSNGLARYDGYEFKVLEIGSNKRSHSFENAISALLTDQENLWVGTTGGILGSIAIKGLVWKPIVLPVQANNKPYSITALVANDSLLFVGTNGGFLLEINKATGAVNIDHICETQIHHMDLWQGTLLVSSESSIVAISLSTEFPALQLPKFDSLAEPPVPNQGVLLQHLADSFLFTDLRSFPSNQHSLHIHRNEERKSFVLPQGYLIVSSRVLSHVDFKGSVSEVFEMHDQETKLSPSEVTTALTSTNGVIWLGTYTGLKKLVTHHNSFIKYKKEQGNTPLPFNYIRSIYSSGNNIWLGSKKDIACKMEWDIEYKTWLATPIDLILDNRPSTVTINTFLTLANGSTLAAGLEGIWILENDHFVPYPPFKWSKKWESPQIWALAEDRYGRIWASTLGNGILIVDPKQNTVEAFTSESPNGLSSNTVWTLFEDRDNCFWAGTQNGLDSISYTPELLSATPLSSLVSDTMDGKEIWQVLEDPSGNFWVGSTDLGLAYFDRQSRSIRNFHKEDGLTNETVAGLMLNKQGKQLWISTLDGLYSLDTENHTISPWSIEDGLLSNEFNFKAIAQSSLGELFLGSKSGLTSFYPKDLKTFEGHYPLQICELRVNNASVGTEHPLRLAPQGRHFSASFALLEYAAASKHRFRHRIKEFEEEWTYVSKGARIASYTNLPVGNYTMEVEASLGSNWITAGSTSLPIEVQARLIEQSWFLWLLALLLAFLITGAIRIRIQRIKEKAQVQVTIADLERRMLTAQMSPHFLFNSMNAIQQFVLCNDSHSAQAYLGKFSKLIRMFLEASKRKFISLRDEIELLSTYIELERLRFENRFEVRFEIDEHLPLDEIEIPNSLIQPFVENAILHGLAPMPQRGILLLRIEKRMDVLVVSIDDNGPGRAHSEQESKGLRHVPKGMALANELASSYSGLEGFPETNIEVIDKKDKHGKPSGTSVNVTINLC